MSSTRITWAPPRVGTGRAPGYTGNRAFPGFSGCVTRRNRHRILKDNIQGVSKSYLNLTPCFLICGY